MPRAEIVRAVRWRLVAYPFLAVLLWLISGWWLSLLTPLLLEVEAAFRRYEERRWFIRPEDPRRRCATLRRGMNWDARFAGWVGLALGIGLVYGARRLWLGPVIFEVLLTLHRVVHPVRALRERPLGGTHNG